MTIAEIVGLLIIVVAAALVAGWVRHHQGGPPNKHSDHDTAENHR
jgi:hypothetical protein